MQFHDFAGSDVMHPLGVLVTGGIAAGIFGPRSLGAIGGVAFGSQVIGTLGGIVVATLGGTAVYGVIRVTVGRRLDQEDEYNGADLSIHKISATSE